MGDEKVIPMDDEEKKKRIDLFFDRQIPVHIITQTGKWVNGYVKEISSEFIIINDRVRGEQLVFFNEMFKIEQFNGDISRFNNKNNSGVKK